MEVRPPEAGRRCSFDRRMLVHPNTVRVRLRKSGILAGPGDQLRLSASSFRFRCRSRTTGVVLAQTRDLLRYGPGSNDRFRVPSSGADARRSVCSEADPLGSGGDVPQSDGRALPFRMLRENLQHGQGLLRPAGSGRSRECARPHWETRRRPWGRSRDAATESARRPTYGRKRSRVCMFQAGLAVAAHQGVPQQAAHRELQRGYRELRRRPPPARANRRVAQCPRDARRTQAHRAGSSDGQGFGDAPSPVRVGVPGFRYADVLARLHVPQSRRGRS